MSPTSFETAWKCIVLSNLNSSDTDGQILTHSRYFLTKFIPFFCSGAKVIKNSYSFQLSIIFFLLINVKMQTVGILTFMSREIEF